MTHNIMSLDDIPAEVLAKAEHEIERIHKEGRLQNGWKKLQKNRGLLRFQLTPKYRLVVYARQIQEGPYLCMNHGTFDNRY